MSVVVYRNGVMAADSRAYGGRGQCSPGTKVKAHRLEDGTRVGVVSACPGQPEKFVAWLRAGGVAEEWSGDKPDLRALVVRPNGDVFLYEDSPWPSGPIRCDYYAIGSGSDFALGAIFMGADAVEAVRAACLFDTNSGGPVTVLEPCASDCATHNAPALPVGPCDCAA